MRIGDKGDRGLTLREELIVDFNVAIGRSANDDTLACQILVVVVDLTSGGPAEDLQLKLDGGVIGVDVDVGRDMDLLRRHGAIGTGSLPVELLQVLAVCHQAATNEIDNDVGLSHVDQHVVFEHNGVFLADEDTIAHAQVLDQVHVLINIILDLEVSTSVLLRRLLALGV